MYNLTSQLNNFNFADKIVFLRADLNVDLNNLATDPQRLQAIRPTLDLLIARGARILLATHIGRPKGKEEKLSTKKLIPWFTHNGYEITFAATPTDAYKQLAQGKSKLVLLENLRFWPEEKYGDHVFARELKGDATYYVNDAFGTLHRHDTSIAVLPSLFDKEYKTIGPLIEKELQGLKPLYDHPAHPYLAFLGGGKVADKLPVIEGLLDYVSELVLCPATNFTFLKALGKEVGKSLVDDDALEKAREILEKARRKNVTVIFPVDYVVAENSFQGPLSVIDADDFAPHHVGIATGPKTLTYLKPYIMRAKTIFFNAAMGTLERPETTEEVGRLLAQINQSSTYSVIGGGDSVAAANFYNLSDGFSFCSTGGGATLYLISGNPLPGLDALVA